MEPALIADIEFKRPKLSKPASSKCNSVQNEEPTGSLKGTVTQPELEKQFLSNLKEAFPDAVIFSSVLKRPPSTDFHSTTPIIQKLPPPLTSLHNVVCNKMTPEELFSECENVFSSRLVITKEEALYLEEATRLQSQSILWHKHRVGRITASKFFAVAHTSINSPSRSLIKGLMEMKVQSYSKVKSLMWGIENEHIAREQYLEQMKDKHTGLLCTSSGLRVNPKYPHLGATPDGVVKCDCCGDGIIEIKCPYKHQQSHPHNVKDNKFCLEQVNGQMLLKKTHEYYYQIQGQLAICEMEYCDFVCWTPHGMHIERIVPDTLLFKTIKPSLDAFFVTVLLPMLITGRTQQDHMQGSEATAHVSDEKETYCWCNGIDEGPMVACDNTQCPRQWFHFECVGLERKPRGKWYCCGMCRHEQ